jgi:hypothetical protein
MKNKKKKEKAQSLANKIISWSSAIKKLNVEG